MRATPAPWNAARRGFGPVRVFWITACDGGSEHSLHQRPVDDDLGRLVLADRAWRIEEYHRVLGQYTEVERCRARLA